MGRLVTRLADRMRWRRPKPQTRPATVGPGAMFTRKHGASVVETARVIDVYSTPGGIPHVRFEVSYGWPRQLTAAEELRVLCLDEFLARYDGPPA